MEQELIIKAVGKKSKGSVKSHIKRSSRGKLVNVKEHSRAQKDKIAQEKIDEIKSKTKSKKKTAITKEDWKKEINDTIKNNKTATAVYNKYVGGKQIYANNLKVMLNGKWKNEWRKRTRNGKEESILERRYIASPKEWEKILGENKGLIHRIVERYGFNRDLYADMKQEALRAVFDGVNNYELKYNPPNPPDLSKHLASYIAGYVVAELGKQMATKIQLPMYKKKLMSKYQESSLRNNGEYDKIFKDLNLKKSDLYPSIDPSEDGKLPREGYVTLTKEGKIKKDTIAYENKLNRINEKYDAKKNSLDIRREYGMDEDSKQVFLDGLNVFDDKINEKRKDIKESSKKRKESGKKEREEIQKEMEDLQNKKSIYGEQFKPVEEGDYDTEISLIDKQHQVELKSAQEDFDKKVDKTTIAGAYNLFKEFDEIESFSYFNVSDVKQGEEGEQMNLEQFIEGSALTPVEQISLTTDFVIARKNFLEKFEMLDPKTAKVLKLHLGGDKDNDLYAHGLWGVPMQKISEIINVLPKDFYKKESVDTKAYTKRYNNWKEKRPAEVQRVKKTAEKIKKESKEWTKRRNGAIRGYKKLIKNKKLTVEQKRNIREKLYKKTKSRWDDKPKAFTIKKLTPKQFELAELQWKQGKPTKILSSKSISDRISNDIEMGKRALARIVPQEVYKKFLGTYQNARSAGTPVYDRVADWDRTGKIMLKAQLRDMAIISKAMGYRPIYAKEPKGLVQKIYSKIRYIAGKIMGV